MNEIIGQKLSEQLRERIEDRIITGVYRPGMRLDETELAAFFGVSRTPIREALIQLASTGVIEMRPRRGAVVAQVAPDRLQEMFDVMAELEAMCASLTARTISDGERRELIAAHQACQTALKENDPDTYYRVNEAFHQTLYRLSHNGFLAEQALALQRRLRPFRRLQLRMPGRMASSFGEHSEVLEAILAGNPAGAADCLRSHVCMQGDRFANLLALIESESAVA
ncbi:GntR family transcriptional regulator [Telmatospirillum siberiense]|uniref:GntR family transcriptional regulator n=1 Tax=Telmatospirillum siberiense TaxID=382514 RepID=UPI0018EC951D|nr:GntR family transcriptional regulator [Telmatospirillum siberiense]